MEWIEALPLGNGRIGAMVYGGSVDETIQVDESTFWSGEKSEQNNRPGTKQLMEKLRRLLLDKRFEEADELGKGFIGNKNQYGTNMPVANLKLKLMDMKENRIKYLERNLDLSSGIASTMFEGDGNRYKREVFVSNPAQILVLKFSAKQKAPYSLELRYDGIDNQVGITGKDEKDFLITGDAYESLHSDGKTGAALRGRIRLLTDGDTTLKSGSILLTDATRLVLLMALNTTMFLSDPDAVCLKQLNTAEAQGYGNIRQAHLEDFNGFYRRMEFKLGGTNMSFVPTDERIRRFAAGEEDLDLIRLTFQYGRYILIAGSRENSPLPTHMGGIWNDNIYNRIDCTQDMHIDMNIQMQYLLAPVCNLSECSAPVFNWLKDIIVPSGTKTAKEVYEAKGWVAHVVSNPWGFTSLGWAYNWGAWSFGGVWTATLLWEHYLFTGDKEFLRNFAYPIIKGAADFVLNYIFYDETSGYYMTGPSYSPENHFNYKGKDYVLSLSTTCDVLMVREIFDIVLQAAKVLGLQDEEYLAEIRDKTLKLPPYQIGNYGQLKEWYYDFSEPLPGHRHTSHLLGIYPFSQLKPGRDDKLLEAAEVSMDTRLKDFEITSWGMAILMSYYARLLKGGKAEKLLREIFKRLVKPNLASVMSGKDTLWQGTWEMDGNTGITAAICEMLVQSHDGIINLLPALPQDWTEGEVKGLCLRGGKTADITWENGKLKQAVIFSKYNDRQVIQYGNYKLEFEFNEGCSYTFDALLHLFER